MDQNERDMLIRLQQDLKNSILNHNQIMTDLKDIFQRIEKESKTVTTIGGDVKYLKERFAVLEKDLKETTESIEEACAKVDDKIIAEREERINADNQEEGKRKTLDTEIRTGVRAAKLLAALLGGIGLLLGAAAAVIQIIQYMKSQP